MLTKNFYAIASLLPLEKGIPNYRSLLPVTSVTGLRRYVAPVSYSNYYPVSTANTSIYNVTGIAVGTGSTAATTDDWRLESPISSGATVTMSSHNQVLDVSGNPELQLVISVKNTGASDLTVREIGWIAPLATNGVPGAEMTSYPSTTSCLFDRTVLETPVVIASNETALINYYIKLTLYPKTISGIEIVPFNAGTDAQIVAIIEAARAGTIDLQTDAGWRIGDMRAISMGAVGTNSAHTDYVLISSFDEYEGCGNIMQLDICTSLTTAKMNSSNTNAGGYGSSYMATTFLPLYEAALPEWLRALLLPFSVKASAGSKSSEIETITNNKIALRSAVEIFGNNVSGYAFDGEGSQVEAFKRDPYRFYSVSGTVSNRWTRSPYKATNSDFVLETNSPSLTSGYAGSGFIICPFMCV